ncbi:MAG: DEAD/DEAH box helicase [Anaeroplasma sp.]
MNFDNYTFKDYIIKAILDLGFKEFTDVQKSVFNELKTNKNILAKSKTGSGKTHAFLIPIFQDLDESDYSVQATIIAPTNELALQIYKFAQHIASFYKDRIDIRLYTGGSDRNKEIERLNSSLPQIVIGTPGKINDLAVNSNVLKIYTSKYFIVDEIDMAFDSGFQNDLDIIASVLTNARMMFFSATISERILPYLKKYMTNVNLIDINNTNDTKIEHAWIPLKHRDRYMVLKDLLSCIQPYFCIIFVNKKENVNDLAAKLSSDGYFVGLLHGDLQQRERKRVLADCKSLKYQYLVATDLAARGIDIEGVSHIINYDIPYDYEFYIHRSGRTGRMYREGIVYTFYEDIDDTYLDNLSKKGIVPKYYEIKDKELIPYKGRNTRAQRIKPKTDYQAKASKYIPKPKKVSPGYKKKRQTQINELADKLKKKDLKNKKRKRY